MSYKTLNPGLRTLLNELSYYMHLNYILKCVQGSYKVPFLNFDFHFIAVICTAPVLGYSVSSLDLEGHYSKSCFENVFYPLFFFLLIIFTEQLRMFLSLWLQVKIIIFFSYKDLRPSLTGSSMMLLALSFHVVLLNWHLFPYQFLVSIPVQLSLEIVAWLFFTISILLPHMEVKKELMG